MSENKCPVCGERLTGNIDGVVVCWSGCSFRCGGYALPRIAAAMDLAKATAAYAANVPSMGYPSTREFDLMQDAEDRVLEVFGE